MDDERLRELMQGYQAGAIESFEALYAHLAHPLLQYLAALSGRIAGSLPVPPEVASLADRQALSRALDAVAPNRREALLLHHVWGFSFAEIGLGVTVTVVLGAILIPLMSRR